jgi:hypothetical protein
MSKRRKRTKRAEPQPAATTPQTTSRTFVGPCRLQPVAAKPVQVRHLALPPTFNKPKRIHPRRLLPRIQEGPERGFHSMTPPARFLPPLSAARGISLGSAAAARASSGGDAGVVPAVGEPATPAEGAIALLLDTELASPGQQQTASNVGEPSAAINDRVVVYSGNWYAAVSGDGGVTFQFIDPATQFPDPPGNSFCCDQVVHYIPQIDSFVWLLQYGNPQDADNIQRLAFATTADVAAGKWRLFDLTTQALEVPGAFLDFPDLAVGADTLYVTTNIFLPDGGAGSAVVRIPLTGIASGNVRAEKFVSTDLQSFRVAQNCGATAFFAAHKNTATLEVFSWGDQEPAPTSRTVGVARWIGGNGYRSRTPDGQRWLDRADPRITGATLAGGELWFAWGVDAKSNHRPNPMVQIARIDANDLTLIDNVNLFDDDSAICYAALGTNADGEVGVSYMIGGGTRFPSHAVGILTGTRADVIVAAGDRAPLPDPRTGKNEWGDYLTVRRAYPNEKLFAATGYTLKGAGDGSNRDATPRFTVFGRAEDVAAAATPAPPVVSPGPGPAAPAGLPKLDVNKFKVASPQRAAAVKARAGVTYTAPPTRPPPPPLDLAAAEAAASPGKERWPVKTGTDPDVASVEREIVDATIDELITIPRPDDMKPPEKAFPAFQNHRAVPTETTVWRVRARIIALKQEADGDYHLVLQSDSGEHMIAEIPMPKPSFVSPASPFFANIKRARAAVDKKLVKHLNPQNFVPLGNKLVPRDAVPPSVLPAIRAASNLPRSFETPAAPDVTTVPAFKTKVDPTPVRITGVGFFDRVHGQMGVSQSNGIELHPVLKVEFQ